jgi:hypothetical protein
MNYTKDEKGSVYYLETFKPWGIDPVNSNKIERLFDEGALRKAIAGTIDETAKQECNRYLNRLLTLLEEEKQERR